MVLGVLAALALTRYLQNLLFGIAGLDAVTAAVVLVAFGGISLLASCVPAYRATRIDPTIAFRTGA